MRRTTPGFEPAYVALLASGELARRAEAAYRHLEDRDLCARYCHVDRRRTIRGAACRTGERAVVSSFGPHHGEEEPLRGSRGSGTIFFSWCNLRCVYCQNWEISQKGIGREPHFAIAVPEDGETERVLEPLLSELLLPQGLSKLVT